MTPHNHLNILISFTSSFLSWLFLLPMYLHHTRLSTIHPYVALTKLEKPRQPGIAIIFWNETLNCSGAICISCQQVTYTIFDGVPVKLYRPRSDDGGPLPGMVYYHGGGCCMGSAGTNTGSCVDNCMFLLMFKCRACNTIQCNAMQCNAMQCNAMQCNAMQCNAMQYGQCSAVQCSATQRHIPHASRTPGARNYRNAFMLNAHLPTGSRKLVWRGVKLVTRVNYNDTTLANHV